MVHAFRARRIAGFGAGVAAAYAAAWWVTLQLATAERPELLAAALTIDLALLVPAAYYWLLVRRYRWPAITVVPVFLASVAGASLLLPQGHRDFVGHLELLVVPLELGLIGYLGFRAVSTVARLRRERPEDPADLYESLRLGAREMIPVRAAADALAFEVAVFTYALFCWRRRPTVGPGLFTVYRDSGYVPLAIALLMAMFLELFGAHFLLQLWSPTLAWIVTGLSAYGVLWFVGDLQAIRLRPISVDERELKIRLGLRWSVTIPREDILDVRRVVSPGPRDRNLLVAVSFGAPTVALELRRPVAADGIYGRRKTVTRVGLAPDDLPRFLELTKTTAAGDGKGQDGAARPSGP